MDNIQDLRADIRKDYKEAIICPYCFQTFSHRDVHFRMESYFDENNLNSEGYLEEELAALPDSEEKRTLTAQTRERKPFMIRDDPAYADWWSHYGETTEQTYGEDEKLPCEVFQLPILNPSDPEDQKSLKILYPEKSGVDRYLELDSDGMAASICDHFGKETRRRVCPFCHNPLPIHYGKSEVKFISVVGITGSGKTVYLSQLLKYMARYAAKLNMVAYPTTDVENFRKANPVEAGKPLPPASVEGRFSQPMVYDLAMEATASTSKTYTMVLYDIAGEDCQSPSAMQKYGKFVQHSSGIMLLIDPQKQLDLRSEYDIAEESVQTEPQVVLETIHNVFLHLPMSEKCRIPLAVCVSKSDSFLDYLSEARDVVASDIVSLIDEQTKINIPEFNATEYNKINQEIRTLTQGPLMATLRVGFLHYNFFAFSATGGPVVIRQDADGTSYKYLKGPATPKRIAEPLFWLLYKFGYIRPNEPILLPEPRKWERRYRITVRSSSLFGLRKKDQFFIKPESAMTPQDWNASPPPLEIPPTAEELERLRYEESLNGIEV